MNSPSATTTDSRLFFGRRATTWEGVSSRCIARLPLPNDAEHLHGTPQNVSGMCAAEGAGVPFVHRLDRNAIAAQPVNVVAPPGRRLIDWRATALAGLDQLIQ